MKHMSWIKAKPAMRGVIFDSMENFKYEYDGGHHTTIAALINLWVVAPVWSCMTRVLWYMCKYWKVSAILQVISDCWGVSKDNPILGCPDRTCIPAGIVTSVALETYLSQNADSTCHSNLSNTYYSNLIVRGGCLLFCDWGNELFLKGCHVALQEKGDQCILHEWSLSENQPKTTQLQPQRKV